MSISQKLKEIRKKFGLSQEDLARIINVSRQAITKWENDGGIPDVSNLQELSKVFGVTVDYLLDDDKNLPALTMRIELDRNKYKNKISSYLEILNEYYPEPYEVYILSRDKEMKTLEKTLDFFTLGIHKSIDAISNNSPYYLVKKDNLKFLVEIDDFVLKVMELPYNTNEKKFTFNNNNFINCGILKR